MIFSRSRLYALATLLAGVLTLPATVAAQVTTGGIAGRVMSSAGEPIESAQIQVTNVATGRTVGTVAREGGRYTIIGLEVGSSYEVTARRIGFQPVTQRGVRVALGQNTPVDFSLTAAVTELGAVTVEASAETPIIAPDRRGTETTISDTLLRRMPTLNRNFTDFVALTPQVGAAGPGLSGGGTNNRFNNIQIDGATESDMFGLGSTGQPGGQANGKSIGLDAVKEYQVLLAPYDVRLGNFSGALINAVTKSGRNDFFGSAYTFGRNQSFVRSQDYINDFRQIQYGASLGGPIVRDKALFFINAEIQDRNTPASGPFIGDPRTNVTQAQLDAFTQQLAARGVDVTGTGAPVTNENPLQNIFARLDFNLPRNSSLVLRHNYGHAEDDNFSRSLSGSSPVFALSDAGYRFRSDKNATVAQLRTNMASGAYNELIVGYTTIRDRRSPSVTRLPQVDEIIGGVATLVAGSERSSQANELDQDIIEITDNFTLPVGASHRVTVGTQNTFYKVRNLFGQNRYGYWVFDSPELMAQGVAKEYRVGVPVTDGVIGSGDGAVRFSAFNWSLYAQDEWTITDRFNVSYGLRVEAPTFQDKPPHNPDIQRDFGRNTADVPSNNITFSPRLGFNWNLMGDMSQQVRGGVGVFTGRPAYVWLSNSFQNSGGYSGYAQLVCKGNVTPEFNSANVATPPAACLDGTTASAGSEVDLLGRDLRFPQNLRANLAYDRQVFGGYVVTLEGMYTRGINNLFYTNIALDEPVGTDPDGRVLYGLQPEKPNLRVAGRDVVLDVTNQSRDYSYNLTAGVTRKFDNNFGGSLFYTYSDARDVQNLTSSTAYSQYRYGRTLAGRQDDRTLATSIFSQPHRVLATGTYTFPTRTSISAVYVGQSGQAFGYVSSGDLNGDKLTQNDPVYVPTGPADPRKPQFQQYSVGDVTYSSADQEAAFFDFIDSQKCLREAKGGILGRNACRAPFTNQVDVSVEQALPILRGQSFTIRLDVINFGNLLNKDWGIVRSQGFGSQQLYTQRGIVGTDLRTAVPLVRFDPGYRAYNDQFLSSNYQMQLSLRYSF